MDQLGAGHVDAARDAHAPVFLERPAVEDHEVGAGGAQAGQLVGADVGCAADRLDVLAERLARHIDALEQLVTGRAPSADAALEDGRIGVAEVPEHRRGAQRGAIALVTEHDRRGPPRHQARQVDLEALEWRVAGEQDVAAGKGAGRPDVEQRELALVRPQPIVQRRGRDPRRHLTMLGLAG